MLLNENGGAILSTQVINGQKLYFVKMEVKLGGALLKLLDVLPVQKEFWRLVTNSSYN